ncbi:MAG: type II secretion system protein [Pseudomonadota bacterium]
MLWGLKKNTLSCRRRQPRRFLLISSSVRQKGMSLLEILVTLAIAGILIAVTAPALTQYLNSLEFSGKADAIGRDIARMRMKAMLEGRVIYFPQINERDEPVYGELSESLPEGWSISGEPILFLKSGACTGGVLELETPNGRSSRFVFEAPLCRFQP